MSPSGGRRASRTRRPRASTSPQGGSGYGRAPRPENPERRQPGEQHRQHNDERKRPREAVGLPEQREVPRSPHDSQDEAGHECGIARPSEGRRNPSNQPPQRSQQGGLGRGHPAGCRTWRWCREWPAELGGHEGSSKPLPSLRERQQRDGVPIQPMRHRRSRARRSRRPGRPSTMPVTKMPATQGPARIAAYINGPKLANCSASSGKPPGPTTRRTPPPEMATRGRSTRACVSLSTGFHGEHDLARLEAG